MSEKVLVTDTYLTNIANVIRIKNGSTTQYRPSEMAAAITALSTGGAAESVAPNDVNFIDFDGTILYSYSIVEAQALTTLPPLPTRDGFTYQAWNWTLASIKSLARPVTVGALCITSDGTTRLHIHIPDNSCLAFPLNYYQSVTSGVAIDWGDGSERQIISSSGDKSVVHNYAQRGDYIISLIPNKTTGYMCLGSYTSGAYVIGSSNNKDAVYRNMLQKVEIGSYMNSISRNAFKGCTSLQSINLPRGINSVGQDMFYNCYSLKALVVPNTLIFDTFTESITGCSSLLRVSLPADSTKLSVSFASGCYSLQTFTIPDSVTEIGTTAFSNCQSLTTLTFPESLDSIGTNAFSNCYSMKVYDFLRCTSVPTLGATAFNNISSGCTILVPSSLYNTWSTATNWSNYASYMVSV